jgi:NSS family neurotransmitter:Na+ symporter
MASAPAARGTWGSRVGFILAAAGSAVGLGNIWRFPTSVGRGGGAAFVLIYLACVFVIAIPIMLAELAIGRRTQRNPVGAFTVLAPGSAWKYLGFLGVLTGLAILSYYCVVAGWTLGFFAKTIAGSFTNIASEDVVRQAFLGMIANPFSALGLHALFMILTMWVVVGGVRHGIERASKILMPILLVILLLLVVRSVTLPGAEAGLDFYLRPDFSKVNAGVVMNALGQAFFSLSLGMGAMITYGSYLCRKEDLFSSAVWVSLTDAGIAVLAGLAIFPALFTISTVEPEAGPGLIFMVLPNIFDKIPFGQFFGAGFFLLLAIAALTSSISLLEVVVAYFVDEKAWSRRNAVLAFGGVAFVLGVPSALGHGAVGWLSSLPGLGLSFLELVDVVFGNFSLTIGALLISLFVVWRWGLASAREELAFRFLPQWSNVSWGFLLRFLCPVAIGAILVNLVLEQLAR